MAKPKIQSRVDPNVEDRIDKFADQNGMSQSEAVRHLLRRGIDTETSAETDGGEVVERVDELRAQNERRERRERRHDALIGLALVVGALVISGFADGLLSLFAAGLVGVALIVSSVVGYWRERSEVEA